jgi:hypothetical protein
MAIVAIAAVALSCATANTDIGDRSPIQSSSTPLDHDVALTPLPHRALDILTAAELAAAPGLAHATAYDAVLRLRASFLHARDARTSTIAARGMQPAVFVNGMYYGEIDALRLISVSAVEEMLYVRPFDAMNRYGGDYRAGAIVVRLRRGAPRR